jgi:hypothetical protein
LESHYVGEESYRPIKVVDIALQRSTRREPIFAATADFALKLHPAYTRELPGTTSIASSAENLPNLVEVVGQELVGEVQSERLA